MTNTKGRYWNYVPCPFWAMDSEEWLKYAEGLKGADRELLSSIPFKWAFVPPNDAATSLQFMREIGAAKDEVNEDVIENIHESMPTFEGLVAGDSVNWSKCNESEAPAYRFRMTPEWENMAGVILNWPVFYPPLWSVYKDIIVGLNHVTTFLRIPKGYLGAAALAWLQSSGVDPKSIRAIPGPIGDIWPRDYSPLYGTDVYSGEAVAHKFTFAAYYEEYRQRY